MKREVVEEEVEDVDVINSGDEEEEEEEFVPGTQEREAAPNLFVPAAHVRAVERGRTAASREEDDDEVEDISTISLDTDTKPA
jgi:hypothetical protein